MVDVAALSFRAKRIIIIACFLFLMFAVTFMGFAYGSARVCSQADGILDNKFVCHLDYVPETTNPYYKLPDYNLTIYG